MPTAGYTSFPSDANEQGMLDMGCAPDLLPGYRPVAYAEFRKRYENVWKTGIPEKTGLTIFEMMDAASEWLTEGPVCYG